MGPLSPVFGTIITAPATTGAREPVSLRQGLAVTGIATGVGTIAGIGAAGVSAGGAKNAFKAPYVSLAIIGGGALMGMLTGLSLLGQ